MCLLLCLLIKGWRLPHTTKEVSFALASHALKIIRVLSVILLRITSTFLKIFGRKKNPPSGYETIKTLVFLRT
jgi:hypothetical protein